MELLLQEFYKHSSFLPFGFGLMAGEAFESRQCRWASGEDLFMQIRFLSSQNQQPPPPELQALYFKTVVYIPLGKGAGVLEIGTKELVPKSESGMIYQIRGFINGLETQGTSMGDQLMFWASSFEACTKALPNDDGNQYGDPDEQYKSASMVGIYGARAIFRHPSTTSSYWSSSSTTSSSTPSASDQIENNSNINFFLNTSPAQVSSINNEDMLMSPASSLQATPKSMVRSFDEIHILNQLDHIDMHGVSTPISLPDFDSYELDNADFTHDHHLHLSDPSLYFSSTNVGSASPPSLFLPDNSRYDEPTTHHNHLLDYVLQPMQCAFSARNDAQVDAHHSLNEIVGGPSTQPTMVCQIEVTSLPSVTCEASSHSTSYKNDQQQQWRNMFSSINKGERMTDLFGQSERHGHAMVSAEILKIPLGEDCLGYKRLEANIEHEIMLEQGAALMIDDEGSTIRNRKLIMGMSGTNSEGYEAFIGDKMSNDQGEKIVVSSTTQAAGGRYVSYGSGSAEDKVVALSTSKAADSCVIYASGSAEADKVAGPVSYASYVYDSAEAYNAVGSSTRQAVGSYASYGSGSAEAEKAVALSTVFSTSYGAGSLIGSGNRDDHNKVQQQVIEFTGLQKLQGVQQDDPLHESSTNPAQVHHVQAERKRRLKQSDCIKALHTLLPAGITKKDKVSILESTIRHLKELQDQISELKQDNSSLIMNRSAKDQRKPRQKISSQENATCDYVEDTMPHFRLSLIKNVQDVEANATIIDIMNALQEKSLHCFEIDSEFWKSTSKLSIKILANHKDAENHRPTLDEIHHIEQWWKHLTKDHLEILKLC